MYERSHIPWLKHLRDIEKHLGKNEKWFQRPEKRMKELDDKLEKWNTEFLEGIGNLELLIEELEKRMEDE
ncbi:hypothetical protein WMZ97_03915 [Lentibacillus sp. N15]|uniref:hypothetical protein n=1 Tax=Lentibacillus songyuanensis TaxID=3136161 RepID=UPI0031BB9F9F